jgi:putative Mg2+ transporter-C (MgtC) family protein
LEELFARFGLTPELAEALRLGLLGRLFLAAAIGGLIGLEREIRGKPAGLRTNLLICMGATLLMELSIGVAGMAGGIRTPDGTLTVGDPGRIAAQIVSGIGFLGAGTILQARGSITGLTTAATIWVVAAIGMAVGARAYVEAIAAAVMVGISLVVLARVEDELIRRRRGQRYSMTLDPAPDLLEAVEAAFRDQGLQIETESVEKTAESFEAVFEVTGPLRRHGPVVRALVAQPGVRRMTREL